MAAGDEQDQAEAYDDDKLDDDVDEPVEHLVYPPDRPVGVNDPTADDLISDSVTSRHDRERPDPIEHLGDDETDASPGAVADRPVAADTTEGEVMARLDRMDAVDPVDGIGPASVYDEEYVPLDGRLVGPGADDDAVMLVDDEKDEIAGVVPADDLSAEEAAIHLEPG
jgi:hypothetical protein